MSVRNTFPQQRPTLNLDFANSKTLDPRITFSRTTTATYVDEDGLIKIAAADESRFDHDPVTGECLGLLVEEQRKNQVTYSEDFTQWVNTNTTDAVDTSVTAPDGTNTATKITDDSTNAAHNVKLSVGTDSSDTFTLSCFVKKGDFSYFIIVLRLLAGGENSYGKFDLDNPSNNTTYGSGTNRSQTVTEYPNGWYRISFTTTFSAASTNVNPHIHLTASGGDTTYSGSGNYNYIWGAQLEAGAFPTSYIPTSGSTATRNPDNASITGDNFSDWYNQSEGSVRIKTKVNQLSDGTNKFPYAMQIDDGTSDNIILIDNAVLSNGNIRQIFSIRNTGTTITSGMGNNNDYNNLPCSFAYSDNDFAFVNGAGTLFTDDDGIVPKTMNRLQLGNGVGQPLNGTISQLTYYPTRLTNTQLQTLTK